MSDACAVSVVLSSFNREALLGPAIERLSQQAPGTPPYEVIIVDNNSTDRTREVVESYAAQRYPPVRYVFEPRQGLSYARNAGIAAARAPVVAFTDDDVRVQADWVGVIRRTFDRHPDIECLGGRTLPIWPSTPPRWLTRRHWVGPLALQDYGDAPFVVDAGCALCLAGANLAFRKRVFDRIGPFSPHYPRSEDTELMLRYWMSGARALYVPEMIVHAAVQPERLTKRYHRLWHANIGRCNARMLLEELTAPGGALRLTLPRFTRVAGVPLFLVRQLAGEVSRFMIESLRRRHAEAVWHEVMARAIVGHIRESAAMHRERRRHRAAGAAGVDREEWSHDEGISADRHRSGCGRTALGRAVDG